MIHARGLSGTPLSSHWSTAAVNASCAHSSARSKSPSNRINVATIRPHSRRYTFSTACPAGVLILLDPKSSYGTLSISCLTIRLTTGKGKALVPLSRHGEAQTLFRLGEDKGESQPRPANPYA